MSKSRDEAAEETLQLEQRASEAGSKALVLAAEIARLRDELELLHTEKTQLTETVADVNDILTAKDAEFHDVLHRIEAASARLGIGIYMFVGIRNACFRLLIINTCLIFHVN